MTLVLEDGTGIESANSYATEDDFDEYVDARSITPASGDKEAALIRATTAIDARYGASFPGYRKAGRDQGLLWPRAAAYDSEGWLLPDDEVPKEVVEATIEAAVRELANPGSMMPDLERGGGIQSIRAGSVGITYSQNASAKTTYTLIDGIIANVLSGNGGSNGGMFGQSVRS